MAIDVDLVRKWLFPELRQTYTARDTIHYGLALGYGGDPANDVELRFVYERGLLARCGAAHPMERSRRKNDLGVPGSAARRVKLRALIPNELNSLSSNLVHQNSVQ